MNTRIKFFLSRTFLIFLLSILLHLVYRDQFVHDGKFFNQYLIFYFLVVLLFLVFLLNEDLKVKIIILLLSTYFLLLTCNIILYFYNKLETINYDNRTKYEVYKNLKGKNNYNTVVTIPPISFLFEKEKSVFPMGGISNALTVNCNENGYWSIYKSDRYGFNNPDEVWDKNIDYLFIGDSFLHGSCVSENETISTLIREKINQNIINIAYGSNGLPLYYINIKEAINYKKIKNIILFLYLGNDLIEKDFELFSKDSLYLKYFNNDNFVQNIFGKQNYVDSILQKKLDEELNKLSTIQLGIDEGKKYDLSKILTLYQLRMLIKSMIKVPTKRPKDSFVYFENTLAKIQVLTNSNNINFFVVILPDYELLLNKDIYPKQRYDYVKKILEEKNIKFIDTFELGFSKYEKSYKKFFANKNSHYNKLGYKLVAETVVYFLNKNKF